jgi:hypothetical protein
MKSISIRNVPNDVYAALQQIAKSNRRSLQEQIKLILEREIKLSNRSFLAAAAEWRNRFQERKLSDTVEMIRKDRER